MCRIVLPGGCLAALVSASAFCSLGCGAATSAEPGGGPATAEAGEPAQVTVFAAVSLTDALTELDARRRRANGVPLKLVFAATSTLARQIENGAGADLFLSADEEWMAYLDRGGLVARDSWLRPIGNRLILIAPAAHGQRPDGARNPELDEQFDFAAALGAGRLAVADPAHVPAGRYAEQALRSFGWWVVAAPRLARAENVRAALTLVDRGEAPLGIVYGTDARAAGGVQVLGTFPPGSHDAIRYSFAAIAGRDSPEVRTALAFLTGPQAREIYRRYGFTLHAAD